MFRFYRVLTWLFAAFVAARFVSWAVLASFAVWDRGDVAYPEGVRVHAVRRVTAGQPLYQDFRRLPHVMVPYGPLYFKVAGRLDRWFGGDEFVSYVIARIVSIACYISLMVLVGVWSAEMARSRWWGAANGAFAAACPTLIWPSVGAQVDSMAILGVTGSLFVATRKRGAWRWCLVWALALAAWATKQNSAALVPALAVWLWQGRGWRAAAAWIIAWLGGVATLWGLFDYSSDGLFTLNMLVSLKRPLSARSGLIVLVNAAPYVGITFAGVAAFWRRTLRSNATRLPAWWFFFAVLSGVASCFGEGGGTNYFLESWVAACLLLARLIPPGRANRQQSDSVEADGPPADRSAAGIVTDRPPAESASPGAMRVSWLALVILGCAHDAWFFYRPTIREHLRYLSDNSPIERRAGLTPKLDRLIRDEPGEVFVSYAYVAVLSRRPPVVLDVVHFRLMVEGGIISANELVGRLTRREYSLIVLREPLPPRFDPNRFMRWPQSVWAAMSEHYRLFDIVDGQYVYVAAAEPNE